MLKYKIVKRTTNEILYKYMPDGGNEYGLVSINTETGKCLLVESATSDIGNRYSNKLMKRLQEFFRTSNYNAEGIVAWY